MVCNYLCIIKYTWVHITHLNNIIQYGVIYLRKRLIISEKFNFFDSISFPFLENNDIFPSYKFFTLSNGNTNVLHTFNYYTRILFGVFRSTKIK